MIKRINDRQLFEDGGIYACLMYGNYTVYDDHRMIISYLGDLAIMYNRVKGSKLAEAVMTDILGEEDMPFYKVVRFKGDAEWSRLRPPEHEED